MCGWWFCYQPHIFMVSSTLLLISCKLFFISISVSFISDWVFFMLLRFSLSSLSILITSVLNTACSRLLVSILVSSFSGVLFYFFIWAMVFGLLILAASLCVEGFFVCCFVFFYVSGRDTMCPRLGRVDQCSRCSIGSGAIASPISQAMCSRRAHHVGLYTILL